MAQAERRAEAAVRHAFEALQLAERNEVEERELLQTLGLFLTSGISNICLDDNARPPPAGALLAALLSFFIFFALQ